MSLNNIGSIDFPTNPIIEQCKIVLLFKKCSSISLKYIMKNSLRFILLYFKGKSFAYVIRTLQYKYHYSNDTAYHFKIIVKHNCLQ